MSLNQLINKLRSLKVLKCNFLCIAFLGIYKICKIVNLPVTVMLTVVLLFPPSASHQYSPLSLAMAGVMVQGPVDVCQVEAQIATTPMSLLNTLHSAELPNPSQLKETDSCSKCCCLFGTTCGKTATQAENEIY